MDRSACLVGVPVLVCLASAVFPCGIAAQSIKISGGLAQQRTGSLPLRRLFTPDGTRLVYLADRAGDGTIELLSVPTDGSAPPQSLNGPLPPGGRVRALIGVGAGGVVAYTADQITPGIIELYSVPADGSASALLLTPHTFAGRARAANDATVAGKALAVIFDAHLPEGGDFVVFGVCREDGIDCTYYRVPLDGSAGPSPILANTSYLGWILFSPDTSIMVWHRTTVLGSEPYGYYLSSLFSMPSDGSAPPVQLASLENPSGISLGSGGVFASDGAHFVYEVFNTGPTSYSTLYSVPLDGSLAPVTLAYAEGYAIDPTSALDRLAYASNGTVYSIANDGSSRVTLSPAGWVTEYPVLAVRGPDVAFAAHTTEGTSVLRASLDGSQTGVPLFAPSSIHVFEVEITAPGTVVYRAESLSGCCLSLGLGLYSVPLGGGPPVLLSQPLVSLRGPRSFLIHPNGQQVAYISDGETQGKGELYIAPDDGSLAPIKLNAPVLAAGGDVRSPSFLEAPQSVAYVADPLIDGVEEVFTAPLDALGPVVRLPVTPYVTSGAIGGDVLEFQPTLDGKRAVYRADGDEDESYDLFVAGAFGRGRPGNLTALLPGTANVRPGFGLVPSGERVVFQSVEQSRFSLHSVSTTPGLTPIELDSSAIELPLPLGIAPDGARVVYRKAVLGAADLALLSAPIDGSSPPVTLHAPLVAERAVADFQISPDGRFAVHRADEDLDDVLELFSVPVDGSAPPVRLHPRLADGRNVSSYRISPDSERVVFLADREAAGRLDLYSVPIDGRPGLRKLDQALLSTRDVLDFAISPDGRAVVYRANALGQDQLDLFRVPIEGLDPPARRTSGEIRKGSRIRLSQLPDAYQTESDYAFTADGTQVLFRINSPGAPQRFDLFRVPADGSSAPVRLSDELPSRRQTVSSFALSPDQSRVVYLSDAVAWQRFELFSVPLAGGPVVRLDSLPSFADVSSYRIDPLSRRVVYLADRIADEALELFEVPLDGSAPAERLNMPLPANGDVESDFVPLLGGRTLYRADQTTNDVLEVFVSQEWRILPR